MGDDNAPDIIPESAVCVTRDFYAAPLFPVSNLQTDSWVYVLDLDVSGMMNTQEAQWNYVNFTSKLDANGLWPMFGQERAVNQVAPGDMVGAVYVKRRFNGNNVFQGGSFLPIIYRRNNGYQGPAPTATLVSDNISRLVQKNQWLSMPSQAQGIVRANT